MNIDYENNIINEPFMISDSFFVNLFLALIKNKPEIEIYTFKKGDYNAIIKNYSGNYSGADYELMISYYNVASEKVVYIIKDGKDIYKLWYTGVSQVKHLVWIGDDNSVES